MTVPPHELKLIAPLRFGILVGGECAQGQIRRNGFVVSFGRRETIVRHRPERLQVPKANLELLSGLFMPDLHRLLPPWEGDGTNPSVQEAVWSFWDAVRERGLFKEEDFTGLLSAMDGVARESGMEPEGKMGDLEKAVREAMTVPGFTKEVLLRIFEEQVVRGVMDR